MCTPKVLPFGVHIHAEIPIFRERTGISRLPVGRVEEEMQCDGAYVPLHNVKTKEPLPFLAFPAGLPGGKRWFQNAENCLRSDPT